MHANRAARHLVAAAFVAGLATASLSVISTQAAGANTATTASTLRQIATNVNDCLHGGYVKYSTTSGKAFNSELGCVIYALFGGVLVPLPQLPDFVLIPSCTGATGSENCTFTVQNLGAGPGTGNLVLDATMTSTSQTLISAETVSSSADCQPTTTADNTANSNIDPWTATASCTDTFAPSSTPIPLTVGADSGSSTTGVTVTITATVNPGHTIAESNYANDSFSQTFVLPATG